MESVFKNKSSKIFWAIGLFFVALFIFLIGFQVYGRWKAERRVTELVKELERIEKEALARKAADTIGGKTPQETLGMFIQAVEKGDYGLASKYLIIENQENGKKKLLSLAEKNNLRLIISLFKNAKSDGDIINGNFRMKSETDLGPYYFIRFVLYPSGNWKIEEI